MLDCLSCKSLYDLIDRQKERLLIPADVIIIVAMQPEHFEANAVTGMSSGTHIQQVNFGDTAFGIIIELVYQRFLAEKEPLRLTMFLVICCQRNKGVTVKECDGDSIRIDTHSELLLSMTKGSTLTALPFCSINA